MKMSLTGKWIFGIISLFLILPIIDYVSGETKELEVVVLEKLHKPASSEVGTGVSPNGKVVMINTHSPEAFNLLVQFNGHTFTQKVDATTYAKADVGTKLKISIRYGGITGTAF